MWFLLDFRAEHIVHNASRVFFPRFLWFSHVVQVFLLFLVFLSFTFFFIDFRRFVLFSISCINHNRSVHDQHSHLVADIRVDMLRGYLLEQWSAFHANVLSKLLLDAGGCARVGSARRLGPCTVEDAFDCHERVIVDLKTHDNIEHLSALLGQHFKDGVWFIYHRVL